MTITRAAMLVLTVVCLTATAQADISIGASNALPLELQRQLNRLGIKSESLSLVVTEVGADTPLVAWQADAPRNPASVMKLVTTFAALSELGPGYQWQTEIRRTGLIRNGTLDGDLIVVGGGDPFFVQRDLWDLVGQLHNRGVNSIGGDLIIDDTFFDVSDHDPGAFDGRRYRPYNVGPNAALFNFAATDFYLVPVKGDELVEIRHTPEVAGLRVISLVRQLPGACRGNKIKLRLDVDRDDGQYIARFSGNYPERCGRYHLTRAVMPSNELLHGALADIMAERGGGLQGNLLLGEAPQESTGILRIPSRTLAEIIRSTNKYSNNVMSQHLFLTIGAKRRGAPATHEKARLAIDEILVQHDVPMPLLKINNGSGLCRDCTLTAAGLVRLLEVAWSSEFMPEFYASLPVPGEDGALKKRFQSGRFKGRIHMKTGTIDHVSAAAGLVHADSQRRYLFALMINQRNIHKGKGQAFQRRLMTWLVGLDS